MGPNGTTSGRAGVIAALGTGAAVAGGLAYVGLVDPHRPGSLFPPCPFKMITGWDCPACGGLRMTHDVLHGDMAAAATDNVFLLVGIPLLLLWGVWRLRVGRPLVTWWAGATVLSATVGWTVVRNLPGFPLVPTLLSG